MTKNQYKTMVIFTVIADSKVTVIMFSGWEALEQ